MKSAKWYYFLSGACFGLAMVCATFHLPTSLVILSALAVFDYVVAETLAARG